MIVHLTLLLPLILVLAPVHVKSYSSGAPEGFCQYETLMQRNQLLRPGHSAEPSNGRLPQRYSIRVGPLMTDGSRRVTLRAAPGDYFKGFFIQATRATYPLDSPDRPAYGTFRPVDSNSQARRCRAAVGQVGGITHTGNMNKTEVSVDWLPPNGCNLGDIQFVATVVRAYSEYWVDIRSDVVQPSGFGPRSLLCRLYVDPYNRDLQNTVLTALRELQQRRSRGRGVRGRGVRGRPVVRTG